MDWPDGTIKAGVCKGIYAGPFQEFIDRCYFEWFLTALHRAEATLAEEGKSTPFTEIFVPVSESDNITNDRGKDKGKGKGKGKRR